MRLHPAPARYIGEDSSHLEPGCPGCSAAGRPSGAVGESFLLSRRPGPAPACFKRPKFKSRRKRNKRHPPPSHDPGSPDNLSVKFGESVGNAGERGPPPRFRTPPPASVDRGGFGARVDPHDGGTLAQRRRQSRDGEEGINMSLESYCRPGPLLVRALTFDLPPTGAPSV